MPTVQDYPDVDKKKYQTIYPQYMDKLLTAGQGRRMPKEKCIENVMCIEMYQACIQLGVPVVMENKGYARASAIRRARLKVLLKSPLDEHYVKKSEYDTQTRDIINPDIPNKTVLMAKIAEIIPTLPSRQKKEEEPQVISTATDKKKKKKK
eukprot:TRINITY_DN25719_c0_g1_i1.p2 TRINITY_DN25719_c0_g1~~TRINITY_DN25719_c0_g1_i1.p2  ORF type:complete len:151 (+),score=67.57 TRINITY_DN25719_c0_g1_i1:163-615(+)